MSTNTNVHIELIEHIASMRSYKRVRGGISDVLRVVDRGFGFE